MLSREMQFNIKVELFFRNLGRDQMLWDSGLDAKFMDNMTAVDNKIAEIDKTFHLVMMAEQFDESMVLLKDLLCWDYSDVINFKLNARKESKKIGLSDAARDALKEYLAADYRLYNYFKKKFSVKLQQFGQTRLEQELTMLRLSNDEMWGQGMVAYTAGDNSDQECQLFAMSELSFIDHLREVQSERAGQLASDLNIDLGHIEDSVHDQMKRLPNIRNGLMDIERLKAMYIHS